MVKKIKKKGKNYYKCEECGLIYIDKKWVEKCKAWCRKYHTCNIEIISHAKKQK